MEKSKKELANLVSQKAAVKKARFLRALYHGKLTRKNRPVYRGFMFDRD